MKQVKAALLLCLFVLSTTSPTLGQKGKSSSARLIQGQEKVVFAGAEGLTDGRGVWLHWQTEREVDNLGFLIYRRSGGDERLVSESATPGSAARVGKQPMYGAEYSLFDTAGDATSQYIVESIQMNGVRLRTQPFFPKFVPDLTQFTGKSSDALFNDKMKASVPIPTTSPVISKELQSQIEDRIQLPDPVMQRWVAARPGAKIGVRQEGIYRVTRAQLQSAGFDVNSDPALWQLYVDGNQQAIVVGPNGDNVEFFGRGIDTVESDTRMYFLVVGTSAGKRMNNVVVRPSLGTVRATNYQQSITKKERTSYVNDILNGDAENYWGRIVFSGVTTFNVNLTAVDPAAVTARIAVRFQGFSTTAHAINISINGNAIGQATGIGQTSYLLDTEIPASFLVEGTNAIQMSNAVTGDASYFDMVEVVYRRRHVADQNRISFVAQNYRGADLEGFSTTNIRLFDVTYDGDPAELTGFTVTPSGPTFNVAVPAFRGRLLYAVGDTGIQQPATIEPNNPSTVSTTTHNGSLIIISYKDFLTQANTWADYRRNQGFSVEVVDVADIFDEFNYGVPSANSIRDFLFYAKNNWTTPPAYALLIGDGSYDPRNYEGNGNWNFVPVKIVNTVFSETASDDAITDFNDDGLAEIAIGRIPARTTTYVTTAFNKVTLFEQATMQSLSRGALCAYDDPNGWDFQGACTRLRDQLPVGTPFVLVGRSQPNAQTTLITEMNTGKYIVNYAGHGTLGAWASTSFFSNTQVPMLTNQNTPSIFTMLTCLNGFFHEITRTSLGENLVGAANGGAVAVWASSGLTTPPDQEIMGQRFYQQVGLGNITRMGDLVIDAKSVVTGGRDVRDTWVLIGDPMLKVR